jgi:hypothetical protein
VRRGLTKLNRLSSLVIEIVDVCKHRRRIGLTDGAAESLVQIKTLEELKFRGYGDFSDEFLVRLAALPSLRALEVRSERFTDKALATMGNMAHIRELDFSSPNLTDEGVKSISKASNLERLVLISPQLSAKSIEYLEPLKRLRELELPIQRIESSTVVALGRMRFLEMLALRKVPIRDDDLIGLTNHPSLKRIFFGSAQLTERSLDVFKSIKNLEHVDLGRPTHSVKLQSMTEAYLKEKRAKAASDVKK